MFIFRPPSGIVCPVLLGLPLHFTEAGEKRDWKTQKKPGETLPD
jgi:hypothetical protein